MTTETPSEDHDRQSSAQRLVSERERLGYTPAQFAFLMGISEALQLQFEGPEYHPLSAEYESKAATLGVDFDFVRGYHLRPDPPNFLFGLPPYHPPLNSAVQLMLRSQQAVDLFFGPGVALRCPQLVAALMLVTAQARARSQDHQEELVFTLGDVIAGAAQTIADAMEASAEDDRT